MVGFAPGPLGNCEDVNECVEYGHQCAFRCHNTAGSYRCVCPYGYQLAPDGRHCIGKPKFLVPSFTNRWLSLKSLINEFL